MFELYQVFKCDIQCLSLRIPPNYIFLEITINNLESKHFKTKIKSLSLPNNRTLYNTDTH